MEKDARADQWYSGRKTVLKPLLAYTPEGFELENNYLCGQRRQFAADCVQAKLDKGIDLSSAGSQCITYLMNYEICKSQIYCPVETKSFLHTCSTKRNTASTNPQCQKSIAALQQCAAASNLSEWWTSPLTRVRDRGEEDDLSVLHLSSQ